MTAEVYINDAGTARKIKQIWVNDANTARQIKEIWVNDNGTARKIYQNALLSTTMQEDVYDNSIDTVYLGFNSSSFTGSLANSTLSDGKNVLALIYRSFSGVPTDDTILTIGGFSSNPGQSYFSTLSVNGVSATSGSASYSYNPGSGYAVWSWVTNIFSIDGSRSVPVVIAP